MTQYGYDDENNLVHHRCQQPHHQLRLAGSGDRLPLGGHAESSTYTPIGYLITKLDRYGNAIPDVYEALNRLTHKGSR